MRRAEFSDTFTTLLNSYNTQAQFGEQASAREIVLDEYEKSVLLTQAQDIIVKSYFDGSLNSQGQGFDDSARRQIDFSSLIKVATLSASSVSTNFDDRGLMFKLPLMGRTTDTCEVLFILNEKVECTIDGLKKQFVVVPINYKEYEREMSKPFAQPLKKQAWRLLQNDGSGYDIDTELILKQSIYEKFKDNKSGITYKIRYIRRPNPIILEDLPDGLEIDGKSNASECELNPIIHMDILNKAVELAITTRGGAAQPYQAATESAVTGRKAS
jgi:hypothetical protein